MTETPDETRNADAAGAESSDAAPVLTPSQRAEGWVVKEQGGMQVKVLDLRRLEACEGPTTES